MISKNAFRLCLFTAGMVFGCAACGMENKEGSENQKEGGESLQKNVQGLQQGKQKLDQSNSDIFKRELKLRELKLRQKQYGVDQNKLEVVKQWNLMRLDMALLIDECSIL